MEEFLFLLDCKLDPVAINHIYEGKKIHKRSSERQAMTERAHAKDEDAGKEKVIEKK